MSRSADAVPSNYTPADARFDRGAFLGVDVLTMYGSAMQSSYMPTCTRYRHTRKNRRDVTRHTNRAIRRFP